MHRLARLGLLVFAACGTGPWPHPAYVGQKTDALALVPYAPPPARVEFVPARPAGGTVWLDGEWVWQARRWAWRAGRWVVPPSGSLYSPWSMVRGEDGSVYYAGGAWRDHRGRTMADPAAVATATSAVSPIVDPDGRTEDTGRTFDESEKSDASTDLGDSDASVGRGADGGASG